MSDEYDKLRAIWYKKLEKSGFQDIESDNYNLKIWSSKFARKESMLSWEAKAVYYQMAANFLNDYKFKTKREQNIWRYHSEGISCRNIANIFSKIKGIENCSAKDRMRVWRVILKLENIMKKMYMIGQNE